MKLRTALVSLVVLVSAASSAVPPAPRSKVAKRAADAGVGVDAGVVVVANEAIDAGVAAPVMAPEVKTLVEKMQGFYEKTQDFTANFSQEYFFKTFKAKANGVGPHLVQEAGE